MELNKRKYKKKQVQSMLDAYCAQYEERLSSQRAIIQELSKENERLNKLLESQSEKEKLISDTLIRAEKTAKELVDKAEVQYANELEKIKKFAEKWEDYFLDLKNKYPMYPAVKKAVKIKDKAKELPKVSAKKAVEEIDSLIVVGKKTKFNPKSKIKDYIAATTDSGFNMDEVLNPGELELEDLCKELGLMETKE